MAHTGARATTRTRALAVLLAGGLLAGCGTAAGGSGVPPGSARADWVEVPAGPLSARHEAVSAWTGREFLVLGGRADAPCPPSADCSVASPPLRDGAAFDPVRGRWRRLAPAPVGLTGLAAVVGRTAYVLTYPEGQGPAQLLSYDLDRDRWAELPGPGLRSAWLVAAGDSLVALAQTGRRSGSGLAYDAAARRWRPLPEDPLPDGQDHYGVWTGSELLLAVHDDVPDDQAPVVQVAALDRSLSSWRRLGAGDVVGWGPVPAGGRVVWPSTETADGGEVDGWGRSYPEGGILDPATGRWTDLPTPPAPQGGLCCAVTTDDLVEVGGHLLDPVIGRWTVVPPLPGGARNSAVRQGGDDTVLVWGGAPYGKEADGSVDTGWLLRTRG